MKAKVKKHRIMDSVSVLAALFYAPIRPAYTRRRYSLMGRTPAAAGPNKGFRMVCMASFEKEL